MALIDRVWAIVKRKRLEEDPSGKHSEFVKICETKRIQISEHHKISGLDWGVHRAYDDLRPANGRKLNWPAFRKKKDSKSRRIMTAV